jgi:hypothetical protein
MLMVDFEVEDTEEAEVDCDDVEVDVEVVVKRRLRTAAPMSILRDVPLDVQAVVFAGPHHHDRHDPGSLLNRYLARHKGRLRVRKSQSSLSVSSIHMRGKARDSKLKIGISYSSPNYMDL